MVSSIGSTSLAQAAPAQAAATRTEERTPEAAPTASPPASAAGATEASVDTLSALSSATARVGDQLQAQSDAARVQPPAAEEEGTTAAPAAAAPNRAPAGGAAPASSEPAATDYIAEADTNSDKKVSDQERIAYEKKLEQQAAAKTAQDRSQEVQKAYGLADEAEPAVATTA